MHKTVSDLKDVYVVHSGNSSDGQWLGSLGCLQWHYVRQLVNKKSRFFTVAIHKTVNDKEFH